MPGRALAGRTVRENTHARRISGIARRSFGLRGGIGLAFTADAGVMFQGGPRVALAASGPITASPGFAANLEQERQKIEGDIDWLRFYPAVKIGVLYPF